jgi:hypothetical protein
VAAGLVLALWCSELHSTWDAARTSREHATSVVETAATAEALEVAERSKVLSPDLAETLADARRRQTFRSVQLLSPDLAIYEVTAPTGEELDLDLPKGASLDAIGERARSVYSHWKEAEEAERHARDARATFKRVAQGSGYGPALAGLYVFSAVVGWVIRGFLGIPRGKDQRPREPSSGVT